MEIFVESCYLETFWLQLQLSGVFTQKFPFGPLHVVLLIFQLAFVLFADLKVGKIVRKTQEKLKENSLDPRAKHEHFSADDIQDLASSRGDGEASNVLVLAAAVS